MILKDAINNTINEGDKLFWLPAGIITRVSKIDQVDLLLPGAMKKKDTVTLEFSIPVDATKPYCLMDGFLKVADPDKFSASVASDASSNENENNNTERKAIEV